MTKKLTKSKQWVLWKYENGRKVPYAASGRRASPSQPRTWTTHDKATELANDYDGIGFAFKENDGFAGIDIDNCIDENGDLNPNAWTIVEMCNSYTEISPSGKGIKIFGLCGTDFDGRRFSDLGLDIEVYTKGRYFTVTRNTIHGSFEHLNDIEETVSRYASFNKMESIAESIEPPPCDKPDNYLERAESYVHNCPGAISGSGGHITTFALACKLVIDFALSEDEALGLMSSWSENSCSPPWTEYDLMRKIRDARKRIGANYGRAYKDDDISPSLQLNEEDISILSFSATEKPLPFPDHLVHVPGVMEQFIDWTTSQNHRKNDILSLIGSIGLMSWLTGRKVVDETGCRTNLYTIGLAPSSGGKQAPLECIKLVCDELGVGASEQVLGKVTSDSAIASQLQGYPSSLCQWDEFGLFLKKTGKGGHLHSVQDIMLELWGATRTKFRAKKYVDSANDLSIVQPCFSILGMSTPGHFWGGLTKAHLEDGFAGRLMVIDSGERAERGRVVATPPPKKLLESCRHWLHLSTGNLADFGGTPNVYTVETNDEANEIYDTLLDKVEDNEDDDINASIWGRAIEKARKLGMLYACSKGGRKPVVDKYAAGWAVELATWTTESFLKKATQEVVNDDIFSQRVRDVYALIRDKKRVARGTISSNIPMRVSEMDEVLKTLMVAGRVAQAKTPTGQIRYHVL